HQISNIPALIENMVKIKLCGFRDKKTVDLAASLNVDFIGFVFCEASARNISPQKAKEITANLPDKIKKIAVIVDANNDKISEIARNLKPDFLQLHSTETLERVTEIKNLFQIPIIKAIAIADESDLAEIEKYEQVADLFLFDTKIN